MVPGKKTKYLSEIESGSEVLVIGKGGKVRIVTVGRSKIETRPLTLIVGESDGQKGDSHTSKCRNNSADKGRWFINTCHQSEGGRLGTWSDSAEFGETLRNGSLRICFREIDCVNNSSFGESIFLKHLEYLHKDKLDLYASPEESIG